MRLSLIIKHTLFIIVLVFITTLSAIPVFAASGAIRGMLNTINDELQATGLIMAVAGAVVFGSGFAADSDNLKARGLQIIVAGGLIAALPTLALTMDITAQRFSRGTRALGMALIGVGAVFFGLGFADEEPRRKMQGIQTMVIGAVVISVAETLFG